MRRIQSADSQRQEVECWSPGAGRRERTGEVLFNGYRVSVLHERSSGDGRGEGCMTARMYSTRLICTLKNGGDNKCML